MLDRAWKNGDSAKHHGGLMTMSVCTDIVKSCPPDMSGHVPDMIPDIGTGVWGRKMGAGRPDILGGHEVNLLFNHELTPIPWGRGYPLCPDMHIGARRNAQDGARESADLPSPACHRDARFGDVTPFGRWNNNERVDHCSFEGMSC